MATLRHSRKPRTKSKGYSDKTDEILDFMRELGLPETRDQYLKVRFFGAVPEELDPEVERDMPAQFRRMNT